MERKINFGKTLTVSIIVIVAFATISAIYGFQLSFQLSKLSGEIEDLSEGHDDYPRGLLIKKSRGYNPETLHPKDDPREVRYRLGHLSPRGYYQDSFDYAAVVSCLLLPLGPGGTLCYRTAAYDFRTDAPVGAPERLACPDAVLLFDGIFLLRSELRRHWDFRIFVDAGFDVMLERALSRDVDLFGSPEVVRERYLKRYIPGEKLYLAEARPRERADVIVRNDDPANPELILRRGMPSQRPEREEDATCKPIP